MTRRRAGNRNKPKEMLLKLSQSSSSDHIFTQMSSNFIATQTQAGPTAGAEAKLHPALGLPAGGSSSWTQYLSSLVKSGGSGTIGFFRSLIIRKIKITIVLQNLDTVAKIMNFVAVPFASSGSFGGNYAQNLMSYRLVKPKTVFLSKAGVAGDTKKVSFTLFPWQIEGFESYQTYASNSSYYAPETGVGTNYTSLYCQQFSVDGATNCANGVIYNGAMDWEVELRNQNNLLKS